MQQSLKAGVELVFRHRDGVGMIAGVVKQGRVVRQYR